MSLFFTVVWPVPLSLISADQQAEVAIPEKEEGKGASSTKEEFFYDDHGKRDPLWPLVSSAGMMITYDDTDYMVSDLVLEGIMYAGPDSVAIINGRLVTTNDRIGAFQVIEITETSVLLSKDNQQFELKLKKEAGYEG